MRLLALSSFVAASAAIAAPQKGEVSPGAISRLGTPTAPVKGEARPGEINSLHFVDNQRLLVATNAGWNTWDLQKVQAIQPMPVGGAAFAAAGSSKHLWIGSAKKLHSIEPPESASVEPVRSWDSKSDSVSVLAVAPGGQRVVYSDGEQKLSVLDVASGKPSGTIELVSKPVVASLTANGRILGVVTRDGAARCYSLSANGNVESLWTKRIARADRVAAEFSPDGRLFATTSAGRVVVLESVTGRQLVGLERKFGEGDIRAVAFSPSGKQLAIGGSTPDPVVRVFAVENGQEQATFTGHLGDINAIAFSPDGKTIASAGADQCVMLWKTPALQAGESAASLKDAWGQLDSLEVAESYRAMSAFLADRKEAVPALKEAFAGIAVEQARIRKWYAELDHDEFRVREAARKGLLNAGLRAAPDLTDPKRKQLGAEGEQRVRLILEAMEAKGLRIPESGLFGDPLRSIRGVRLLETIGGKEARAVLEEVAKGAAESRLTKEAKAALETWPD